MPSDFHPDEKARFDEATRACVAGVSNPMEIVSTTTFRFGRDIRNGREVEIDFACSADKCVIVSGVVYVDVKSIDECICLGGIWPKPQFETPVDDRCRVHGRASAAEYSITAKPSSNGPELLVMADGELLFYRLRSLLFGREVLTIDGAPPRALDIERFLKRRPNSLPRVIQFRGPDKSEVHYVTRDVFTTIESRYRDTLRRYGQPPIPLHGRVPQIWIPGSPVSIDDTRTDDATKAWLSVRAAIEDAARSEAAADADRDAPVDDCSVVRDLPWTIGADRDGGRLELVYAGWIPELRDQPP
jgi:hypothetical protein